MSKPLRVISSMATRQLLAELAGDYTKATGQRIELEAVGGVDAARRVQAGEAFDGVVLAANAIAQLISSGHALRGSAVDLVQSGIAVAVRAGAVHPRIDSEQALRDAVLKARAVGYSTGPSGTYLLSIFERWGVRADLGGRIVQAPPGVPVAGLVAEGRVELGFQQLSELIHATGIDVVGPLPPATQQITVFAAAIVATSAQPKATSDFITYMASPATRDAKRRQGLEPAV